MAGESYVSCELFSASVMRESRFSARASNGIDTSRKTVVFGDACVDTADVVKLRWVVELSIIASP